MGEKYEIPRMPQSHEIASKKLRALDMKLDILKWRRDNLPLSADVAQTIDELVDIWQPIRDQLARETHEFHAEQKRRAAEFPPLHSVGGES